MTKKNQDSQRTSDGPSPEVMSGGFANPGMRLSTIKMSLVNFKQVIERLAGEATRTTVVLTDSVRLLEALAIRYGDTPIVEVADMLLDEANKHHEENQHADGT